MCCTVRQTLSSRIQNYSPCSLCAELAFKAQVDAVNRDYICEPHVGEFWGISDCMTLLLHGGRVYAGQGLGIPQLDPAVTLKAVLP